jgi:flagellar transcriptional activator FlhC
MNTTYAERHIRALGVANECAALGARSRTIEFVTGLSHGEVGRLFFPDRASAPRGRPPASPDWYHSANLVNRAEASIFVSIYRRIRELDFGPAEALVSGYKHYLQVCSVHPRVSFDRGFDLASHMDGLWIVRVPNFSLMTCPTCTSQYVTSLSAGPASNQDCPFCKLVKRYPRDPRLQTSFPLKPIPDVSAMDLSFSALTKRIEDTA